MDDDGGGGGDDDERSLGIASNIRVVCRCRPVLAHETSAG
jgi:hypothetical protein